MFKTLIICVLALICLQAALADQRLNTRLAGNFTSSDGQFPYMALIQYKDAAGINHQFSGIIYSSSAVITSASNFDAFPATGADVTVNVGAFQTFLFRQQFVQAAATIAKYDAVAGGAVPISYIYVPTQYAAGNNDFNIAVVGINTTQGTFNFTDPLIAIANFPTSSLRQGDNVNAVAYGNLAPNQTTFPTLKWSTLNKQLNSKCAQNLSDAGITGYSWGYNFCVQSTPLAQTGGIFEGVCAGDIGGAIVRSKNILNATNYYEVIGLISYADDVNTCDSSKRAPILVNYLAVYQAGFFTPIAGSLSVVGNKQDASKNPNAADGNFFCGNGVVEANTSEKCDFLTNEIYNCCNNDLCHFARPKKLCGTNAATNQTGKACQTKFRCNGKTGECASTPKRNTKGCLISGAAGTCKDGTCVASA